MVKMGKISMRVKKILKAPLAILVSILFLVFTKIKFGPILGTKMKFSISVFLGPTFGKVFGIGFGTGIIALTQIFGILFGFYKAENLKHILVFLPIISATFYFGKIFRNEKKIIIFPLFCIIFFIFHPIGKKVWFYSLFWLIPIIISLFKEKIDKILRLPFLKVFGYSLGTAFVDHATGSLVYLYLLNIPAHFWIKAIPFTIIERLLIASGISLCYFAEIILIRVFERAKIFQKAMEVIAEKV